MSFAVTHLTGFGARRAAAGGDSLPGSYGSDVTSTSYTIKSQEAGSYPASNCFGNTSAVWWASTTGGATPPVWVGQDFGAGNTKHIRKITIKLGGDGAAYTPDTATLKYSDDGSSYTAVNEFYSDSPTLTLAQNTTTQTFEFATSAAHRYWRIEWGGTGYLYSEVDEIEMFEGA